MQLDLFLLVLLETTHTTWSLNEAGGCTLGLHEEVLNARIREQIGAVKSLILKERGEESFYRKICEVNQYSTQVCNHTKRE